MKKQRSGANSARSHARHHGAGREHSPSRRHGAGHEHSPPRCHGEGHEHSPPCHHGEGHDHEHSKAHGHGQGHAPSHEVHQERARARVCCAVVTCSDSRDLAGDTSGALIVELLESHGHIVEGRVVVKDDPRRIVGQVRAFARRPRVQAVLLNGGTGLTRRDSTFEAIDGLLDKRLTGFGELFRQLSYIQIGAAAMLSRATAGVFGQTVLFSMPGSTAAVRLAMEELILPQLEHVVWLVGKHAPSTA